MPATAEVLMKVELRIGDLFAAAQLEQVAESDLCTLLLTAAQSGGRAALLWHARRRPDPLDRPGLFLDDPAAGPWLVRLARNAGDRHLADRVAAMAGEAGPAAVDAVNTVHAVHARALAAGDPDGLLRAALAHRDPWCAARAHEDLAPYGDAAVHLVAALTRFEAVGAVLDAARVRMHLRALGRRPGRPAVESTMEQPATGWAGLSVTERTIAHLVGNALTNRQIATRVYLSPHTVNYHLRVIFQKLGIGSRVQLAHITRARALTARRGAAAWSA
jgi:DNA-binding CsgD family transcriptional regulator